jgi:hypothetical protein
VKDLRKQQRELTRKNRELERELAALKNGVELPPLGPKPSLESLDYDTGKYEEQLQAWYERKRQHDTAKAQVEAQQREQQKAQQQRAAIYQQQRANFGVADYEDAEAAVIDVLSEQQQGAIIHACDNPALVVYALGKDPRYAATLASEKDMARFLYKLGALEGQIKMQKRKPATPPEKKLSGSGAPASAVDSTLAALRAEAMRTGDYTKVTAYKRKKRA